MPSFFLRVDLSLWRYHLTGRVDDRVDGVGGTGGVGAGRMCCINVSAGGKAVVFGEATSRPSPVVRGPAIFCGGASHRGVRPRFWGGCSCCFIIVVSYELLSLCNLFPFTRSIPSSPPTQPSSPYISSSPSIHYFLTSMVSLSSVSFHISICFHLYLLLTSPIRFYQLCNLPCKHFTIPYIIHIFFSLHTHATSFIFHQPHFTHHSRHPSFNAHA